MTADWLMGKRFSRRGRGPGSYRRAVCAAVFLAVATTSVPANAAPLIPAFGSVEGEEIRYASSCNRNPYLEFFGRMPAGSKIYTAILGEMRPEQACDGTWTLRMHATTPSGFFDWTCNGTASLLNPFTCTTVQAGGSFKLRLFLKETPASSGRTEGCSCSYYLYEGYYRAEVR